MKKTLLTVLAASALFTTGCKQAPTADQATKLEETRAETQANEDLLSETKKERLQLEKQLPEEESK